MKFFIVSFLVILSFTSTFAHSADVCSELMTKQNDVKKDIATLKADIAALNKVINHMQKNLGAKELEFNDFFAQLKESGCTN